MPSCRLAVMPVVLGVALGSMLAEGEGPTPFPLQAILPKDETGAARFLERHPEFDGRGVTIAIFDTGVDPGAPGLQVTSDGRPKVIDVVDATGGGDVLLTTVRKPSEGKLEGLSGRQLAIPATWSNPGGEFRLGLKRGFELFPSELVVRLRRERRQRWDALQRTRAAELRRDLAAWDEAHPTPTATDRRERRERQARLDVLADAQKKYEDPGPVYDCLAFHDGQVWRAVVDTDEDGDLAEETLLTDYRVERQQASFSADSQLNFAVNVYEEGRRLSIVTVCGDHGTHVAGIAAANYPGQPERNGLAPGAQIVSVKIGDTRLDGMETGAALARGIQATIDRGCDLINMSYGEATSAPDRGRLIELMSEAVHEHGVIFVASAGNSGPALSTVGAPGGTTSAILGVGAYVSPALAAAAYSLREELPGLPFTWTSRGPAADGDFGVDLFAPGGAVAPVPGYTLQPSERMNGTSMASPNACGGIALLLSGLKAEQIPYTPHSVRRAVQNTAAQVEHVDPAAQGPGLLQVDRAFEHLLQFASAPGELVRLDVRVSGRETARGINLRETVETSRPATFNVRVTPRYRRDAAKSEPLALELPLTLRGTADWMDVGEHLLITSGGGGFEVRVDPAGLAPGVHFGAVEGLDPQRPERGALFRLPVTVVKPSNADPGNEPVRGECELSPGGAERLFVAVPEGATWADLRLSLPGDEGRAAAGDAAGRRWTYMMHAVQLMPGHAFEERETLEAVALEPGGTDVRSFAVEPGRTLEVCLAQYWSSLGNTRLGYELTFRGLRPDIGDLTLPGDGSAIAVDVASQVRREYCSPSGKLTTWRQLLPPTKSQLSVLPKERNELPGQRTLHELVLTYDVSQTRTGEATIRVPALEGLLYEAPVVGHQWMLFDEHKRLVTTNDMYADEFRLPKGEYMLRLQVLHTDAAELETWKETLAAIDRPLEKELPLSAAASRMAERTEDGEFVPQFVDPGERALVWWHGPDADDFLEECRGGDLLLGTLTYVETPEGEPGAATRPEGFPVQYVVPPQADDEPPKLTPTVATEKLSTAQRLDRDVLELQLKQLSQLKWPDDRDLFEQRAAKVLADHPGERRVPLARLHVLDDDQREQRLPDIVAAADTVIATINRDELARHFGTQIDTEDESQAAQRKVRTAERDDLVDALYRKGRALAYMELPEVIEAHPIADAAAHEQAFEENFRELAKWADTTDEQHFLLHVRRDRRQQRLGLALQLLNRRMAEISPEELHFEKRRDLYGELGWDDWRDYEQRWLLIRFPLDYQPF